MKKLIYTFCVGAFLFSSGTLYAQEQESLVVMSEENIVSLTSLLRQYKKQKSENASTSYVSNRSSVAYTSPQRSDFESTYLRQQIALLERKLNERTYSSEIITDVSDASLIEELETLRYAIQQLDKKSNTTIMVAPSANQKNRDTLRIETIREVAVPGSTETIREVVVPNRKARDRTITVPVPVVMGSNDNKDYAKLQAKVDSLYALAKAEKTIAPVVNEQPSNYDAEFIALQNRMNALKAEMATKNEAPTSYDILKAKYKNYSKNIFFANDATSLSLNAKQTIDELYNLMDDNENLDVIVKGFASNKGNPLYNETLSMRRTEAIKKALMLRGVHPNRVLTQYHGIDYKAEDASNARRAELSFLIRK